MDQKIYKRPWGTYEIILKEDTYLVKRIIVLPNKRLSLQYHNHRAEHWTIVQGVGVVTLGNKKINVEANQNLFIEIKQLHRIENIGENDLIFIETQVGTILSEDDIVRIEDDFGRN